MGVLIDNTGSGSTTGGGFFKDINWNDVKNTATSTGFNVLGNLAYGASGRRRTKVGSTLHGLSTVASMIPGIGPAAGAFMNILGGLFNSSFGSYVNEEAVDAMENRIKSYAADYSSPSSNEQLLQDFATTGGMNFITNKDIDSEGPEATKITARLNDQISQANRGRVSHMIASANALDSDYDRNMRANFSAFGGPITGAIDYANMMDYTTLKRKQIDKGLQYAEGGGIHIKPSKRGTFTAAATKHGMGVQEFANKVLANKGDYSPAMVKKANFARNARNWKHEDGGWLDELNNNPVFNIVKFVDPTGISSYYDVYSASKDLYNNPSWSNAGALGLETIGAVPLVGKLGKVLKIGSRITKGDQTFRAGTKTLDYLSTRMPSALKDSYDIQQYEEKKKNKKKAFGGDLMTNGATWDNGFTYIGNGGSHEANPNEGVQVGVDPQGIPNLVEEGEVIWNDYVFSKRLKVPKSFKDKYKLKNNNSISFAEAAKKFAEENKERPNDPISKKGRDALLTALMDQQEEVRLRKQQREAKAQFNLLTPDEQLGIMQMAQQNAMPVGPEGEYNNIEDNTMINPSVEEQAPKMAAYGGRLFEDGGNTDPEEDKKNKIRLQQTYSRYAPVIGSGIGVFTDLLGITNTPDFSSAQAIEKAAERVGTPSLIRAQTIGNRLAYTPFDTNYYANRITPQTRALAENIMDSAAGNPAQAMAGLLALDRNASTQMGDLFRKAEEYNLEQRAKVADFNRATDIFNAQQALTADRANQQEKRQAAAAYAAGIAQAEALKQRAKQASDNARSTNLTNFLQGLGDIGRENEQRNWLKMLYSTGYFGKSSNMEDLLGSKNSILDLFKRKNSDEDDDDKSK